MPTPFTHLEFAQRLLSDIDVSQRAFLQAHRSAFLLGSIAADARVGAGVSRESTHFYAYDQPINEHPWRVMLQHHPSLCSPRHPAHRAFLAGYVAHLALDEAWSLQFVRPQFILKEWNAPRDARFFALHLILIYMDRRDETLLEAWQAPILAAATPSAWLPFIPDAVLSIWRDFIAEQIRDGGQSKTVDIFSERLMMPRTDLVAVVDSPSEMQKRLWNFVSMADLQAVEPLLYQFTRQQMNQYLIESSV